MKASQQKNQLLHYENKTLQQKQQQQQQQQQKQPNILIKTPELSPGKTR